ncbi:zinc finger, CCHC-type, retrotransposon gag domain protein [Tanacetum coccineum]
MLASTQNDNKKRTREDEQDENEARSGKQRDNHRNQWRQNTQQGNGRDQNRYPRRSNASSAPITECTIYRKRHPSNTCYKATRACYTCGGFGHRAKDCKNKDRKENGGDDKDGTPKNGGRVFAMTASQFEKA